MFRGSFTALVTPFRQGNIDWPAFDDLVEWQIDQGSHGLVLCGTTGESPTITADEHRRIVERGIALVKGRIPVLAGTGSNATARAIEMTRHAQDAGADAALIVTPYYNKPTQDGLYAHFEAIAGAATLPIVIYNIPARCVVDMTVETMARLSKIPNIVGVKDATADLARIKKTAAACGPDFCQLSGEDGTALSFLEEGGHGCISVTSNAAPALCADMHNAWIKGDKGTAAKLHEKLMPLHQALFVETSPAPVKYALHRLDFCTDEVRLPLVPASAKARQAVDKAMAAAQISAGNPSARPRAAG